MDTDLTASEISESYQIPFDRILPLIREADYGKWRSIFVVDDSRILLFSGKNIRMPDDCFEREQSSLLTKIAANFGNKCQILKFEDVKTITFGADEYVKSGSKTFIPSDSVTGFEIRRIQISGGGKCINFDCPSKDYALLGRTLIRLADIHNWECNEVVSKRPEPNHLTTISRHLTGGLTMIARVGIYFLLTICLLLSIGGLLLESIVFASCFFGAFMLILLLLVLRGHRLPSKAKSSADKAGIEPFRSVPLSWLLKIIAVAILLSYFCIEFPKEFNNSFTPMMISAMVFIVAARILHVSQRLAVRPLTKHVVARGVGHCLYLRSFNRDLSGSFNESMARSIFFGYPKDFTDHRKHSIWTMMAWANPLTCYRLLLLKSRATAEEQLFSEIDPISPVVAIGKPGDSINLLGAGRTYVSNEEWQNTVIESLETAKYVIIQPGSSKHIFWEIDQTLAKKRFDQVLLWLTGMNGNQAIYDDIRLHIEMKTGLILPRALGRNHFLILGSGEPRMLPLVDSHPFLWPIKGCSVDFRATLYPFLGPLFNWPLNSSPSPHSRVRKNLQIVMYALIWQSILIFILVIQMLLLGVIFDLGPFSSTERKELTLVPKVSNPPRQGIDWDWYIGNEWSDYPNKPENYTKLKYMSGTVDDLICGILAEQGVDISSKIYEIRLQDHLRGSSGISNFYIKNSETVVSDGLEWQQFEFVVTFNGVPLHYLYRVYASPTGTYTLVGWSLQRDFDKHKNEFTKAFDLFSIINR